MFDSETNTKNRIECNESIYFLPIPHSQSDLVISTNCGNISMKTLDELYCSASQRPCPNVHKHKKASEFNVSLTNKCKGLDYISLKICGIYVETCPHLHPVFFILDR